MRRRTVRISIVLLWLVMSGWFLRYEAFPQRFTRTIDGYRSMLNADLLLEDSWMRVLFNDKPIGYSHTHTEVDETSALHRYQMENDLQLRLKLMGQRRDIDVETEAKLNVACELQEFTFALHSSGYSIKIDATRAEGNMFDVSMRTAGTEQRSRLEIPDDVVIYSPMTELAMRDLKPGEELKLNVLDPASLSTAELIVKGLRREQLVLSGSTNETTVLSVMYQGMEVLSWVSSEGTLLKQATPFGWTLEACSPADALAALRAGSDSEDLLTALAVPCKGAIGNPQDANGVQLRFTGVPFEKDELQTPRQKVLHLDGDTAELRVLASAPPGRGEPKGTELQPFLASSMTIQSDDPDMRRKAQKITKGQDGSLRKTLAIFDWVYKNVEKEITVSLPSALDVLRTMKGDCNEHTYLFVALARAAGVPAKVVVGLAYKDGAFYYHAWPAVHLGEWHELDPTWGQRAVDVGHIALAEGEMADQLRIAKVMGRLKIEILRQW